MKHKKRQRSFLVGALLCLSVLYTKGQAVVSISAGFTASKVAWKKTRNGAVLKNHFNPGYQLSLLTNIPVMQDRRPITLQTGLRFSTKGYRQDYGDRGRDGILTVTPWYAELPLNILYYLPGDMERVFIGAGGYIAYGLGGPVDTEIQCLLGMGYRYD